MGREARANQPTTDVVPFQFYVPIAKVDKEQRLVSGVATCEILDKQGDITDYETAKAFFTNPDLWPGNIREMHAPKAVGKKVEVECDDANKVITLTSRVSKGAPDTWEKVLDGTLSMYSIGGSGKRVAEQVGDKIAKRLYLQQLAEVSLVDNGANPLAKFDIVKSADGKLVDAQPDDPAEPDIQDPVAKAAAALDAATDAAATPVVVLEAGSIRKLVGALATAPDRLTQKADIVAKATAAGPAFVAELPARWQSDTVVEKGCPESYDIDQALSAISVLEHLLASEYYEAQYSVEPDAMKLAQVAAIKAAIDATLRFLVSEHQEQFSSDANGNGGLDGVVEMFVKSLDVVQKAGARHSKGDLAMIQKVHDLSGTLGAACKEMDDSDVSAAAQPTTVVKADAPPVVEPAPVAKVEPTEPFQKLAAELETTKVALVESQATVAKQAETVTALDARLKRIEGQPLPGGPAKSAHAVDKTLGGPGETPTAAAGDEVCKVLEQLAKDATTDEERRRIVTKTLEYRRGQGLDRVHPITGHPISA